MLRSATAAPISSPCAPAVGSYSSSDGFVSFGVKIKSDCDASITYWSDGGESWKWVSHVRLAGQTLCRRRGDPSGYDACHNHDGS